MPKLPPAGDLNLPSPALSAKFNRDNFTTLIEQHGQYFLWSRALVCACQLSEDTDGYNPVCTRCSDGWRYVSPRFMVDRHLTDPWIKVRAVLSSMSFDQQSASWVNSPWTTSRATLTMDGQNPVSYKDRFISLSQRATFSQVLRRLDADLVPIGWLGRTQAEQVGSLKYEPMAVNYLEDEDGVAYYLSTDFDLIVRANQPVRLQWRTGRGPAVGAKYSINYDCHPVWVVDDASYAIQMGRGPNIGQGLTGATVNQYLPTTFDVRLDQLPLKYGT